MRIFGFFLTGALVTVLWVVPSAGTHGQGTLGNRFSHADQDIFVVSEGEQQSLIRGDRIVLEAILKL